MFDCRKIVSLFSNRNLFLKIIGSCELLRQGDIDTKYEGIFLFTTVKFW